MYIVEFELQTDPFPAQDIVVDLLATLKVIINANVGVTIDANLVRPTFLRSGPRDDI